MSTNPTVPSHDPSTRSFPRLRVPAVESLRPLLILGPYLSAQRGRLMLYLLLLITASVAAVGQPLLLRRAIDDGLAPGEVGIALTWTAAALLLHLVDNAVTAVGGSIGSEAGCRLSEDARHRLFDHTIQLPYAFHSTSRSGALAARLSRDPVELQYLVQQLFGTLVGQGITLMSALVTLAIVNPWALLAVVVLTPLFVLPVKLCARRVWRASREQSRAHADIQQFLGETLGASGALTRILFATGKRDSAHFAGLAARSRHAVVSRNRAFHTARFFTTALASITVAAVYALGALGGATVGDVIALAGLATLVYTPVLALASQGLNLSNGIVAAERIGELTEFGDVAPRPAGTPVARPAGSLAFRNVTFTHPDATEATIAELAGPGRRSSTAPAVSGLCFELTRGTSTALVGASGSGKTTTALLAAGVHQPDAGTITIDDVPIGDLDPTTLHAVVGMVTQDAHVNHTSLRDNLLLARHDATEAELLEALDAAQLGPLLAQMPDGLDTVLGDRGVHLSGGERQRLSLARVLLTGPDIVILDEATAHLDPVTERALQRAMARQFAATTQLVIAHRAETIARADRVLRLDRGRIVRADHAG